jgi:16S rRNA (adenine1518-N6/adenine1519-N6)-dimethyltransferase
VLTQAFYDIEYLFTVSEGAFHPPPKVKGGVIRLQRKINEPDCNHQLFKNVVKTAFNQRRKMISNSLKMYAAHIPEKYLNMRPEQLGLDEFVEITQKIQANNE